MKQKAISNKISISAIQKEQVYFNNSFEGLIVSIEKGMVVPEQPAPTNAVLYVILGKMEFEIDGEISIVESDDLFTFSKVQMHGLKAVEDYKFLISRTPE